MTRLLVGPLGEAAQLCAAHRPSHLVSWLSPPAVPPSIDPALAPEHRLHLSSHDVSEPTPGLTAPDLAQVEALLAFARSWNRQRPLLVHCWAGVSRSTAAAYAIACQARPDLDEMALAKQLRRLSPTATPNPLVVRLADGLLGREDRMSAAIAAIGRGAETALGTVFELDLGA